MQSCSFKKSLPFMIIFVSIEGNVEKVSSIYDNPESLVEELQKLAYEVREAILHPKEPSPLIYDRKTTGVQIFMMEDMNVFFHHFANPSDLLELLCNLARTSFVMRRKGVVQ